MGNTTTYLEGLSRVPLFARCDRRELKAIAKRATRLRLDPGHRLIREGDRGQEFFVIVDGEATVTRGTTEVSTLGPGDFFGELALLDHAPCTATVTVASPMEALVIDGREFRSLLEDAPHLTSKVLAGLAARVRELDSRLY